MRQGVKGPRIVREPRQRVVVSMNALVWGLVWGFVTGFAFEWLYDNFQDGKNAFILIVGCMVGFATLCVAATKLLEFR